MHFMYHNRLALKNNWESWLQKEGIEKEKSKISAFK